MTGDKQTYSAPRIEEWGTIQELTQTGLTRPGNDAKSGSVQSMGQ